MDVVGAEQGGVYASVGVEEGGVLVDVGEVGELGNEGGLDPAVVGEDLVLEADVVDGGDAGDEDFGVGREGVEVGDEVEEVGLAGDVALEHVVGADLEEQDVGQGGRASGAVAAGDEESALVEVTVRGGGDGVQICVEVVDLPGAESVCGGCRRRR